jgi:hypothetical protein
MELFPMAMPAAAGASSPTRQPVPASLTRAAIFLVVTINSGGDAVAKVQSLCADLAALLRAVVRRRWNCSAAKFLPVLPQERRESFPLIAATTVSGHQAPRSRLGGGGAGRYAK